MPPKIKTQNLLLLLPQISLPTTTKNNNNKNEERNNNNNNKREKKTRKAHYDSVEIL